MILKLRAGITLNIGDKIRISKEIAELPFDVPYGVVGEMKRRKGNIVTIADLYDDTLPNGTECLAIKIKEDNGCFIWALPMFSEESLTQKRVVRFNKLEEL